MFCCNAQIKWFTFNSIVYSLQDPDVFCVHVKKQLTVRQGIQYYMERNGHVKDYEMFLIIKEDCL